MLFERHRKQKASFGKVRISSETKREKQGKRKVGDPQGTDKQASKSQVSEKRRKSSEEQLWSRPKTKGVEVVPTARSAPTKRKKPTPSKDTDDDAIQIAKEKKPESQKTQQQKPPALRAAVSHTVLPQEDVSCPCDAPEEEDILKGQEVLRAIKTYYTFGISEIFVIPVESIQLPSAVFVYRMFNQSHALEVAKSMMKNPGQEPHIADLIPYLARTKKLLHFENTREDRKAFHVGVKKREIQFLAISGQHSAKAAQWIQDWAEKDAKLNDLASKLQYRKARILSDLRAASLKNVGDQTGL